MVATWYLITMNTHCRLFWLSHTHTHTAVWMFTSHQYVTSADFPTRTQTPPPNLGFSSCKEMADIMMTNTKVILQGFSKRSLILFIHLSPVSVFPGGVCDTRCWGAGGILIFKTASSNFSLRCPGLYTHLQIPPQDKTVCFCLFFCVCYCFRHQTWSWLIRSTSPSPTCQTLSSLQPLYSSAHLSWNIFYQ